MSTDFEGFPKTGLLFLEELAENNNKEWFTANKTRFEHDLLNPAVQFTAVVGEGLKSINPAIQVDLRTNGSGSLMRIYRDTRFSADKTPYKTAIAGMWWQGSGRKTESPAFGFHLESRGMALMAGIFAFDKSQLKRYREAVVDPENGTALRQIVDDFKESGEYTVVGESYKRIPSGFDPQHPNADLLLYSGLYVHLRRSLSADQVNGPGLVGLCLDHFRLMAPIQQWLAGLFA